MSGGVLSRCKYASLETSDVERVILVFWCSKVPARCHSFSFNATPAHSESCIS